MKGLCIFCGGGPTTNEHWLAQWIHDLLGPSNVELWRPAVSDTSVRWRASGRSSQGQVKTVCASCNSGWMSNLENAVKPVLGAMMRDISVPLDRETQRFIAAWGTKTSMVVDSAVPSERWFYRQDEREHLRATLSIPNDTLAWLGRCHNSDLSVTEGRNLYRTAIPDSGAGRGEGYVTTITISRLILQIITIRIRDDQPVGRRALHSKPGNWDESLVKIWPPGPLVHWPPVISFDEPGLGALAGRFALGQP